MQAAGTTYIPDYVCKAVCTIVFRMQHIITMQPEVRDPPHPPPPCA